MLEIGDPPADLGDAVARVSQGHDDVVVNLGQCGSMSCVAQHTLPVGIADHAIGARRVFFQPGEQGGPEVEADARIVVHDPDDLVLPVHDARGAVGGITFGGDAFVPVVVGGCRVLRLDGLEPGILARRLVEMAVNADVSFRRRRLL